MAIISILSRMPVPSRAEVLASLEVLTAEAEAINPAFPRFYNPHLPQGRTARKIKSLREQWAHLRSHGSQTLPDSDPEFEALRVRFIAALN